MAVVPKSTGHFSQAVCEWQGGSQQCRKHGCGQESMFDFFSETPTNNTRLAAVFGMGAQVKFSRAVFNIRSSNHSVLPSSQIVLFQVMTTIKDRRRHQLIS